MLVLFLRRDTQITRKSLSVEAVCSTCHRFDRVQPCAIWDTRRALWEGVMAGLRGCHLGHYIAGNEIALGALLHEIFWELVIYLRCVTIDNIIFKENISRTLITWNTWNRSATTIFLVVGMETCMTPRVGRGNRDCSFSESSADARIPPGSSHPHPGWKSLRLLFSKSQSPSPFLAPGLSYGCN